MLAISPHHRRCPFRPQGQRIIAAIVKGIHLLFDDIGRFADGAFKEFGFFHDGNADFGKTVGLEDPARCLFHKLPGLNFAWQDIVHTFNACDAHFDLT